MNDPRPFWTWTIVVDKVSEDMDVHFPDQPLVPLASCTSNMTRRSAGPGNQESSEEETADSVVLAIQSTRPGVKCQQNMMTFYFETVSLKDRRLQTGSGPVSPSLLNTSVGNWLAGWLAGWLWQGARDSGTSSHHS